MSNDRNPYYDSARDKPDRSEFASLRMDMQPSRKPSGGNGLRNIVLGVVALVVIAVIVKRFLLA